MRKEIATSGYRLLQELERNLLTKPIRGYDLEAYPQSQGYVENTWDEKSMNSAGPYSWTFNRKLPIQEKLWPDEGPIHLPKLLWVDTLT